MTNPIRTPQQLMEEHQGLVRSLAWAMRRSLPENVDIEDLIGYGQVGLAEAARDFDPSLGHQFSTFAYYRIRGAMCDGLSKLLWYSRSTYKRMQFQQLADNAVQDDVDHPSPSEAADVDGNTQWFSRMATSLAVVYLATHGIDGEDSARDVFVDQATPAPDAVLEDREARDLVRELIEKLPENERLLMQAAYFEGVTLQEAGARQGHDKSWASRLHAQAIDRLGRALRGRGVHEL
jgi:RNA polymerase sigma factor for flagellar operon FliA